MGDSGSQHIRTSALQNQPSYNVGRMGHIQTGQHLRNFVCTQTSHDRIYKAGHIVSKWYLRKLNRQPRTLETECPHGSERDSPCLERTGWSKAEIWWRIAPNNDWERMPLMQRRLQCFEGENLIETFKSRRWFHYIPAGGTKDKNVMILRAITTRIQLWPWAVTIGGQRNWSRYFRHTPSKQY